jgi:hypothetical protein
MALTTNGMTVTVQRRCSQILRLVPDVVIRALDGPGESVNDRTTRRETSAGHRDSARTLSQFSFLPDFGGPSDRRKSVNSNLPYLPDGTGIRPVRVGSKPGGV